MRHPFRIGETYGNRVGTYQVVSIDEPNMVVRYNDGKLLSGDIEIFARIWENMQIEAEATQSCIRNDKKDLCKTRRSKGKRGEMFTGLVEGDFTRNIAGTHWRAEATLGGLLAQKLSDATGTEFKSWPPDRTAAVFLTYPERYTNNKEQGTHHAKFAFELHPDGAHYGFYIERNWGEMDDTWDWLRFLAALQAESSGLKQVSLAMQDHTVTGQPVL